MRLLPVSGIRPVKSGTGIRLNWTNNHVNF
jgi:hypothetical protein